MDTIMNASIRRMLCTLSFLLLTHLGAMAHDFTADIAQYNKVASTKKLDSKEAIAARVALERSQGIMDQADIKMLLKLRSTMNATLRELGEQPAFLSSEMKRIEAAMASPKTTDPAKLAKARELYQALQAEMPAYSALENEGVDSMKQALKLIETAPAK
jgi:hypothetical protein